MSTMMSNYIANIEKNTFMIVFWVFCLQYLGWPLENNCQTAILSVCYSVPWIFPWFLPTFCLPPRCREDSRQYFECLDYFPWRFITPLCRRCNTRARSTRRHVCHLFMLRTTVCSCAAPTWERFPARGSVTWLFLFQVSLNEADSNWHGDCHMFMSSAVCSSAAVFVWACECVWFSACVRVKQPGSWAVMYVCDWWCMFGLHCRSHGLHLIWKTVNKKKKERIACEQT